MIELSCRKIPANESYLRVYFMGRFNGKVVDQKCALFTGIGNDYSIKIK